MLRKDVFSFSKKQNNRQNEGVFGVEWNEVKEWIENFYDCEWALVLKFVLKLNYVSTVNILPAI